MPTFTNPVLAGSYPDPSVCRVGEDFYLVTSSFAYYPGIPVFHSHDLVHWRQLTHVLNRPEHLSLQGFDTSDGIWAPTIRHHNGTFYVVSTIAKQRRGSVTFIATATNPAGPWSDPIPLEAEGIDPSLFFDDDGRCWFTGCRDAVRSAAGAPGELWMRQLDLQSLTLVGPTHVLWHGAMRGAWVEAPHIYKRDGVYYLIAAEGGTEGNHSVTAARADAVTGPYVTDPRNPLLTHRHRGRNEPVQNVGHADLVDTADGETWALTLGVRPINGSHTLGREVFLVPVEWTTNGPVFAPESGCVRLSERLPSIAGPQSSKECAEVTRRVHFGDAPLGLEWNNLRGPADAFIRPAPGGAGLDCRLSPEPLTSKQTPAFIGRRQQHIRFSSRVSISFAAADPSEAAGLAVFQSQARHATLALTVDDSGAAQVVLKAWETEDRCIRVTRVPAAGSDMLLAVEGDETSYAFHFKAHEASEWTHVASIERAFFSTESAGGFVGVYVGLYGTSNGQASENLARIHWFEYGQTPQPTPPNAAAGPLQVTG
ncbi:glycoside hydrolase family 43 protein [Streptomyces sp. NPDC057460]|uniref:glycoside hydrolase family 43 protein n=1 Tax=Streptomyces sp. NPDC057460 TaxID=3346141 RepID=UPI0036A72434